VKGLQRVRPGATVAPQEIAMRLPDDEGAKAILAKNLP
jgi:hypothetical protein